MWRKNRESVLCFDYTHKINKKNNCLLIHANSASWAFVPRKYESLLGLLPKDGSEKELGEIERFFKGDAGFKIILNYLWDSGILKINNRSKKIETNVSPKVVIGILKITKRCNLKCSYCYVPGVGNNNSMDAVMIELIAKKLADISEQEVHIVFHGGEPLLNFNEIKKAVQTIKSWKMKKNFTFSIQTNGTILNKEILEFIHKEKISFGISLDGLEKEHNSNRSFLDGRGSFRKVISNIDMLNRKKNRFGVLTVLNSKNIFSVDSMLDFYYSKRIFRLGIIPFQRMGKAASCNNFVITPNDYFKAMSKVFDRINFYDTNNSNAKSLFYERELSHFVKKIIFAGDELGFLCKRSPCGAGARVFGFDYNGDVYVCDDFIGDPNFFLGNIKEHSLFKMREHKNVQKIQSRCVSKIKGCKDCAFQQICCGGCAASAYNNTGDLNVKSEYCAYYKKIISYIFDMIEADKLRPENFILEKECQPYLRF